MVDPQKNYWQMKLEHCKKAFEKNNFEVFIAGDVNSAKGVFLNSILPKINVTKASWGDSMTLVATGILDAIRANHEIQFIETFDPEAAQEERMQRRREALLCDLFLTGTNAVTETGVLVNLDMVGNRVAGLTFGPQNVVLIIGRNKITTSLDEAIQRVKHVAAPGNAIRHKGLKTPCKKTAACMACRNPDRICNTWCITEKCLPKGRIKIILINQDLGL